MIETVDDRQRFRRDELTADFGAAGGGGGGGGGGGNGASDVDHPTASISPASSSDTDIYPLFELSVCWCSLLSPPVRTRPDVGSIPPVDTDSDTFSTLAEFDDDK